MHVFQCERVVPRDRLHNYNDFSTLARSATLNESTVYRGFANLSVALLQDPDPLPRAQLGMRRHMRNDLGDRLTYCNGLCGNIDGTAKVAEWAAENWLVR